MNALPAAAAECYSTSHSIPGVSVPPTAHLAPKRNASIELISNRTYYRTVPIQYNIVPFQAANAARATLGINVAEYCVTEESAGVTLEMTSGGASWGTVKGLDSLVAAGRRLVEEAGWVESMLESVLDASASART